MLRIHDTPLTPPLAEPVTLAECKLDSRVDGTQFDTLLPTLIQAARLMCEHEIGRKLITQTWRVEADDWSDCIADTFALTPFQSATVSYWNGTDWASLVADQFGVVGDGNALSLTPAYGVSWPSTAGRAGPCVRLDVVCGYGDTAAAVPANLRMWIRAHVAAMLRSPDAMGEEKKMTPLHYLAGLLSPHKAWC